jgi:putative tryptophan/tyrosine transport system substrate-binding protein
MSVVGVLSHASPPASLADMLRSPFNQGISEMGFVYGQNVTCECRWAEFHYDRLPALAADLVSRKVDVIVAGGTTPALAAKNATSTIPIVFTDVSDPVGSGLVASLARLGGNVTGFSNITAQLTPKRLELLCELVPQATVIALLVNPDNLAFGEPYIMSMQDAAHIKGVQLPVLSARTDGEIDTAFPSLGQLQAGGLVVSPDGFFYSRSEQLAALASRYAIPAISQGRQFAAAGGLKRVMQQFIKEVCDAINGKAVHSRFLVVPSTSTQHWN